MNLFTHNKVIKIFALILILLPSISMAGKHDGRGHGNDRQDSERHISKHERRQQRRHNRNVGADLSALCG